MRDWRVIERTGVSDPKKHGDADELDQAKRVVRSKETVPEAEGDVQLRKASKLSVKARLVPGG